MGGRAGGSVASELRRAKHCSLKTWSVHASDADVHPALSSATGADVEQMMMKGQLLSQAGFASFSSGQQGIFPAILSISTEALEDTFAIAYSAATVLTGAISTARRVMSDRTRRKIDMDFIISRLS